MAVCDNREKEKSVHLASKAKKDVTINATFVLLPVQRKANCYLKSTTVASRSYHPCLLGRQKRLGTDNTYGEMINTITLDRWRGRIEFDM
jgi:hypothetical protein